MAAPYQSTSVVQYNNNPPSDDGAQVETNRVKWATIKGKLTDPLNAFASAVNSAISNAFAKIVGGAGITNTSVNYTVQSSDQGALVRATVAGITIETPDATGVGAPFVFRFLNDSDGDVILDGSGTQTIDGVNNIAFPAGTGAMISTDGTNWFTDGQNFQRTQIAPQGYLTLVAIATNALSPVPTSDVSAAAAVYYRPLTGDLIPIPDGANFAVRAFSELTLTLNSNHVASAIYDVFAFDDSGTLRLGTGPAWNTATAGSGARGSGTGTTELFRLKGLLVNNVAMTARNGGNTYSVAAKSAVYLGSIHMDGTNGQVSCHAAYGQSRKWGVWNAYNRKTIKLRIGDSTASWTYNSATVRQSRATAGNVGTMFTGLAEESGEIVFTQKYLLDNAGSGNQSATQIGIGVNSTTAASGKMGGAANYVSVAGNIRNGGDMLAEHTALPALGINNFNCLEAAPQNSNSQTFYGTASDMLMLIQWQG